MYTFKDISKQVFFMLMSTHGRVDKDIYYELVELRLNGYLTRMKRLFPSYDKEL